MGCKRAAEGFPTILGTDPTYGCYWEWVWQDLGPVNAYMHRPTYWGVLQFSPTLGTAECRNIAHPVRWVAQQLFLAQKEYKTKQGTYTDDVKELLDDTYCNKT